MGNYSFNRNKVLEDDSTVAYPWQNTIGNKVGQRFGLVALGLFDSYEEIAASPVQTGDTRPGDIKYKDVNGDGKIDEYDKVPIGWGSVPEIMYGFGFSVGWKNLSLTAMFQGAAHVDAVDIDDWADANCRENVAANGVADRVSPMLGDVRRIAGRRYDFILANINRNILAADMPAYAAALAAGGDLVMSGFLEADLPAIAGAAAREGLTLAGSASRDGWMLAHVRRP